MNDPNNHNMQGQPQFQQQYPQATQSVTQPRKNGAVSGGEMFVGINLLSKIGVIFIIIGVIAFSAASEGFIHVGIRMTMVILLGFIMLAAGELFYRKGSVVFANALIFGGVAELFICSLIGYHGFGLLRSIDSIGIGLGAAAVGVLLSVRYKSQGLLIVTTLFSLLPIFVGMEMTTLCAAAVYFIIVHCAVAVIARKKSYNGAYVIGIITAIIETLILDAASGSLHMTYSWARAFVIVLFIICCSVCYISGLYLNAVQENGKLTSAETVLTCIMLGFTVIFGNSCLGINASRLTAGIAMLTLAVIFTIIVIGISLRFGDDCTAANVLFNFIFITIFFSLFGFFGKLVLQYTAIHVFGAALLTAGLIFDRRLFRGWGMSVTALAECLFFVVLSSHTFSSGELFATFVNIILWFGIMAVYIVRKKYNTTFFRVYTLAALLNAGLVCSNLITHCIIDPLGMGIWNKNGSAETVVLSALLCTVPWLILGFVAGKLKYMKTLAMISSFVLYGIGFICLINANFINSVGSIFDRTYELETAAVIATIAVNAASVLPVLDMALQIQGKAPKFAKAVGLIVSGYALMSLTTILGTNDFVTFTSFIISIIYIVAAAVWIVIGFKRLNALLRRFGLALALLSSAKLFLFDFSNINNMGRTLLFIGFGITLLCIAFGYGIAEKKLKENNK